MGFSTLIILADIQLTLNPETGKNYLTVVKETEVYADKQEVGLEEYYSAIGNKINLVATFEIPAHLYHGEKYILTEDRKTVFEVSRAAKGRSKAYIRLPVTASQNTKFTKYVTQTKDYPFTYPWKYGEK